MEIEKLKIAKWAALGITVLSGVLCLLRYCVPGVIGLLSFGEANTIGIIGGADGPTSIILAKSSAPTFVFPVIFVVSLLAWLLFRSKSKNSR